MSSTLELLEAAANNNHGITLQPRQVRTLAGFIMDLQARNEWLHNMCVAYMNEFGTELFYALTEDELVEGEVDDAESGDDTSGAEGGYGEEVQDPEGEQEGPVQEEAGLHAQVAEESEQPLEVPHGKRWDEEPGRQDGPYVY